MKYSIIIPTYNELDLLTACISSVFRNTKDFELIVVDNGSTDNTQTYLNFLVSSHSNVLFASLKKNMGFAPAVNIGLARAKGEYIILLNNDTLATPGWAFNMVSCIPKAEKFFCVNNIALVGPVTNNAGGDQQIESDKYSIEQLDTAALEHHKQHSGAFSIAGFLSGFCLLFNRKVFEKIGGFDESYKVGGWEDNDFCLRAALAGFKAVIDKSTYIHHYGQTTLKKLKKPYPPVFLSNQLYFFSKFYDDNHKKLITVCRARNADSYLPSYLSGASKFSDEIIVLLDRTSDNSEKICNSFTKVTEVIHINSGFDEYRDRSILLRKAQEHGANWVLSLDVDEIVEDSFTYEYCHSLLNPLNPEILCYDVSFRNFFNGRTHFRSDGIFGNLHGVRLWRILPDQKIRTLGHSGLHCTHGPMMPPFYSRFLRTRIKHYGYDTPDKCKTKYDWYTKLDPDPDLHSTGPTGYNHLVSSSYSLINWQENCSITLCMIVRDEEMNLFGFLSKYYQFFDDIVIVDTGSKDRTIKIAETFGCRVFTFKWCDDFSKARNFAKSKCTTPWIFFLDPDEEIDVKDFSIIFKLTEGSSVAYLFQVFNFLKDGTIAYSDNVRLIRNTPEIYFSNYVHENISASVSKNHLDVGISPISIRHFGYLKGDKIAKSKASLYGIMLKRQIRDYPKNPIGYFHYAFHQFRANHDELAVLNLKKCLELQSTFFLADKELALYYLKLSHRYFSDLKDIIPNNHYFYNWAQEVFKRADFTLNCYPDTN